MKENDNKFKILKFINDFVLKHGYAPSVREICKKIGLTSTSTVFYHLKKLEDEGLINRDYGKNRAIKVNIQTSENSNKNLFNVIGKVAAGKPIFAVENIENQIEIPPELFGINTGDMFILNVSGDSMVNAGIFNGDKIIVKKQETAENGEIVVAMVDDSATVKRFYNEKGHIRLQPENDFMEPIIVDDCKILGIVTGLIRQKIR